MTENTLKSTETPVSREAQAMYMAASIAFEQALNGGDTDMAGAAILLLNLQNNYTRLLKGLPVVTKGHEPLYLHTKEGGEYLEDLNKMRGSIATLTTQECEVCNKAFEKRIAELRSIAALAATLAGRKWRGPAVKQEGNGGISADETGLASMTPKGVA